MSLYDYCVEKRNGETFALDQLKGKVLLVANTATGCGFTPQYEAMQNLYDEARDRDFEIIDVPCNQFGEQAPGSNEEIHTFCIGRFGITFPQFAKADVRGETAIPLFRYLADNTKFEGFGKTPMALIVGGVAKKMDKDYKKNSEIKWNFTKFLIDREGEIIARFEPTADMKAVAAKVREIL